MLFSEVLSSNLERRDRLYKLIALDLDGSLLNDEKEIPKENLDVLHQLVDKGYEVVIATGRSYYSARRITGDIKEELIYICNNGNIVRDALDDRLLATKFLDPKDSKIILEEGFSRDLDPIIHVDFFHKDYDIILGEGNKYADMYNGQTGLFSRAKIVEDRLEDNLDRVLALVYPGNMDILKDFNYSINQLYPDRYNSHIMENIQMAEGLLEIMNPLGTKWNSLIEYASSQGIKAEEIIAIGDDNNDIEMIMNAGLGIAMKNAGELVKEVANKVSKKDNNNSGIAFELKKLLYL